MAGRNATACSWKPSCCHRNKGGHPAEPALHRSASPAGRCLYDTANCKCFQPKVTGIATKLLCFTLVLSTARFSAQREKKNEKWAPHFWPILPQVGCRETERGTVSPPLREMGHGFEWSQAEVSRP